MRNIMEHKSLRQSIVILSHLASTLLALLLFWDNSSGRCLHLVAKSLIMTAALYHQKCSSMTLNFPDPKKNLLILKCCVDFHAILFWQDIYSIVPILANAIQDMIFF